MKNIKKLFLTSTLLTLSGTGFLGAMDQKPTPMQIDEGNTNANLEAQIKALLEKNKELQKKLEGPQSEQKKALKEQVEALQHQVAQNNDKLLKRLQKRTERKLNKTKAKK